MCFACHRTILLGLSWTSTLARSAGSDPERPHAPVGLTWSNAILTSSASIQPQLNPSRRTMINGGHSWIWLAQRTTRRRAPCTRHDDDDDELARRAWTQYIEFTQKRLSAFLLKTKHLCYRHDWNIVTWVKRLAQIHENAGISHKHRHTGHYHALLFPMLFRFVSSNKQSESWRTPNAIRAKRTKSTNLGPFLRWVLPIASTTFTWSRPKNRTSGCCSPGTEASQKKTAAAVLHNASHERLSPSLYRWPCSGNNVAPQQGITSHE